MMSWTSIGDRAQYFRLNNDGTHLQRELQRLTSELSTGRVADIGRRTGGDFAGLADVDRGLRLNAAYTGSIARAGLQAEARQASLERLQGEVSGFAPQILAYSTGGSMHDIEIALADASDRLGQAVSALNTSVGGVSLFAGDAFDQPALMSGDEMLQDLRPLVAGIPIAADMVAIVEDWFLSPGGGFETAAWQGGADQASPAILGDGLREDAGVTALDPALRETLAGLALAALAAENAGPATDAERRALVTAAAMRMQSGEDRVIALRAELGTSESRIEQARVSAEAARASLEIERSRILGADPYRTASDLDAVEVRLESLYIVTARLSALTLTEYLR
jgi:flagellar hook-associated protein 3 FlgL